jgi:hypothetical protein
VLSSGDRELLVDPGTAIYNGAPRWRNYFRSTRAHNTVVIDERIRQFQGARSAGPRTIRAEFFATAPFRMQSTSKASMTVITGCPNPVTHRRRILHVRPHCWVIADDFRGEGPHSFETLFHFSPLAALSMDPRRSPHQASACDRRIRITAFVRVLRFKRRPRRDYPRGERSYSGMVFPRIWRHATRAGTVHHGSRRGSECVDHRAHPQKPGPGSQRSPALA